MWKRKAARSKELDDARRDRDGVLRDTTPGYRALQKKHVERLRKDSRNVLPPALTELVLGTQEPFIQAIFDGAIPAMGFGRVCIMGDAAFVARPHPAAGTAQAAEDASQVGRTFTATG